MHFKSVPIHFDAGAVKIPEPFQQNIVKCFIIIEDELISRR